MNQQQQEQQAGWTPIQDAKKAANILVFLANAVASPVEVFLRTKFGSNYFGMPSVVALLLVPMWALFWPQESPAGICVFWLLFIAFQLRARIETFRMLARGEHVHTRYNGWPRLARIFKRMPESRIKAGLEPLLVFAVGVLMMPLSQPLGSYLMVAAFALGMTHAVIDSVERARALEMNDAMIEQQALADRFRQMNGGR
ncbi:hypothetical protein [Leptolyngbya sp. 7M]|uniref:hypothetical protein n=1 Tax=Leptolyngbya sp. 7M TaxID=2812896 RepID=UPI001B8AC95C|nr:hypothetical protein [Leptolyngbya sp. 7M]QYO62488.1 hypothetical protein JVX88_20700 [Leptolyngbya sp. 7M]QYU69341.1 hypothetical protein J4558_04135 [Leptolyngbya sp. 15MV]